MLLLSMRDAELDSVSLTLSIDGIKCYFQIASPITMSKYALFIYIQSYAHVKKH